MHKCLTVSLILLAMTGTAAANQSPTAPERTVPDAAATAYNSHPHSQGGEFTFSVNVELVALHTAVVDGKGRLVDGLSAQHVKVYEDDVQQELAVFLNEDVPVTVGLVLDNSASMRRNRRSMKAGAVSFIQTSNPLDEIFLVNFNSDYQFDLEGKEFSSDIEELKTALEKTTTRGSTAFHDAVRASLKHLKRGTHQKRVLLVVSDGVDTTSLSTFESLLDEAPTTPPQSNRWKCSAVGSPVTSAINTS
jgi:VWFA-related protein